jgi:hypothetical protein
MRHGVLPHHLNPARKALEPSDITRAITSVAQKHDTRIAQNRESRQSEERLL